MVTSISVALEVGVKKSGRKIGRVGNSQPEAIYSPELPEQPVVNNPEDAGHVEGATARTLDANRFTRLGCLKWKAVER